MGRHLFVTILGKPTPAGRPRVMRLKTGQSHTYMPDASAAAENLAIARIAQAIEESGWGPASKMPIQLELLFCLVRPKKPRHPTFVITRPDLDNLVKLYEDAATKAGVWVDDSQVCRIKAAKHYVDGEEWLECVQMDVREID